MSSRQNHTVWLAASGASVALVVVAVARLSAPAASEPHAASAVAPAVFESGESSSALVAPGPDASQAVDPRPHASHAGTVRQLLEREYGRPWNEIRGMLADPDADPEKTATLLPWEEALPHVRQSCLFRDEHSGDVELARALRLEGMSETPNLRGAFFNPEHKELTGLDVQNLEHIDAECVSRLHDAVSELNALIPRCMADQFDRGGYVRVPLLETQESRSIQRDEESAIVYRSSTHGGGWTVYFEFGSRGYPELEKLAQEVKRLKLERVQRLREYIAAL